MKLILQAATAFAAALMLAVSADAQNSPIPVPMNVTVPDLSPKDMQVWVSKSNAYVKLLNDSLRAVDSIHRYESWVNMETGPIGKERYITYGLYSVDPQGAKEAIEKARAAANGPPPIPALDDAASNCASAYETLVPILNDASAYYDRKDYMDDGAAGAKALHAKLVRAIGSFLTARKRLEPGQEELSAALDKQELALIEKNEGKSGHWHLRNLSITAKAALNALPVNRTPEETKAFSAAILTYAQAVHGFDDFNKTAGKDEQTTPDGFLADLREMRDKIENKQATQNDFQHMVSSYNSVVQMINNAIHIDELSHPH
jgi:hypothetical protein